MIIFEDSNRLFLKDRDIYYPNNYGIYIPTCGELIASNKTNDEIAKELQVKKVI